MAPKQGKIDTDPRSTALAKIAGIEGEVPPPPRVICTLNPRPTLPMAGSITISVRPDVSTDELVDLYLVARERLLGSTRRVPSLTAERRLRMAVFAAEHRNDPGTWAKLMKAWNREHPEEEQSEPQQFTRDCKDAYRRVTGKALVRGQESEREAARKARLERRGYGVMSTAFVRADGAEVSVWGETAPDGTKTKVVRTVRRPGLPKKATLRFARERAASSRRRKP